MFAHARQEGQRYRLVGSSQDSMFRFEREKQKSGELGKLELTSVAWDEGGGGDACRLKNEPRERRKRDFGS